MSTPDNSHQQPSTVEFYRRHAPWYDWWTSRYERLRRQAVDLLDPAPGDTVLDVGCGTGLCFAMLIDKIGSGGRVIGIDQSPEMLAQAAQRIQHQGWGNVILIEAPAEEAVIPGRADDALFCAVHDILRSPPALERILAHVRPGGRVVATGGKWAPPWMVPVNLAVLFEHLPFVATFEGFTQPWSHLARFLDHIDLQDVAYGTGYLLAGTLSGAPAPTPPQPESGVGGGHPADQTTYAAKTAGFR